MTLPEEILTKFKFKKINLLGRERGAKASVTANSALAVSKKLSVGIPNSPLSIAGIVFHFHSDFSSNCILL